MLTSSILGLSLGFPNILIMSCFEGDIINGSDLVKWVNCALHVAHQVLDLIFRNVNGCYVLRTWAIFSDTDFT